MEAKSHTLTFHKYTCPHQNKNKYAKTMGTACNAYYVSMEHLTAKEKLRDVKNAHQGTAAV